MFSWRRARLFIYLFNYLFIFGAPESLAIQTCDRGAGRKDNRSRRVLLKQSLEEEDDDHDDHDEKEVEEEVEEEVRSRVTCHR